MSPLLTRTTALTALLAATVYVTAPAQAKDVAVHDMSRYCVGEASARFDVKPNNIKAGEPSKGGQGNYNVDGKTTSGHKIEFRCHFTDAGEFRWVRTMDEVHEHHSKSSSDKNDESASDDQDVNVSGTGQIIGGGTLTGRIFGHREGHYALSMTGHKLTCTGSLEHAPDNAESETTTLHCTNGEQGTAIITKKKDGQLLTFNLGDGTGGYINFR